MNNELKNPRLKQASDALLTLLPDAQAGVADHATVKDVVSIANAVTGIESQDLKGRLVSSKLIAIESKVIDQQKQIAA